MTADIIPFGLVILTSNLRRNGYDEDVRRLIANRIDRLQIEGKRRSGYWVSGTKPSNGYPPPVWLDIEKYDSQDSSEYRACLTDGNGKKILDWVPL